MRGALRHFGPGLRDWSANSGPPRLDHDAIETIAEPWTTCWAAGRCRRSRSSGTRGCWPCWPRWRHCPSHPTRADAGRWRRSPASAIIAPPGGAQGEEHDHQGHQGAGGGGGGPYRDACGRGRHRAGGRHERRARRHPRHPGALARGRRPRRAPRAAGHDRVLDRPESPYHKPFFASGKKFVFFCAGGMRSALATQAAQNMGLSPVAHRRRLPAPGRRPAAPPRRSRVPDSSPGDPPRWGAPLAPLLAAYQALPPPARGMLLLLVATIAFATMHAVIRIASSEQHPFEVASSATSSASSSLARSCCATASAPCAPAGCRSTPRAARSTSPPC